MSGDPKCRWCVQRHEERYLCDPARRILDALYAKGMEGNMPTIEFPDSPLYPFAEGAPADLVLVSQMVVQGATVPAAGVPHPALVFTGRDHLRQPLPRWLYAAGDGQMADLVKLVADMGDLAVRTAQQQRQRPS